MKMLYVVVSFIFGLITFQSASAAEKTKRVAIENLYSTVLVVRL